MDLVTTQIEILVGLSELCEVEGHLLIAERAACEIRLFELAWGRDGCSDSFGIRVPRFQMERASAVDCVSTRYSAGATNER